MLQPPEHLHITGGLSSVLASDRRKHLLTFQLEPQCRHNYKRPLNAVPIACCRVIEQLPHLAAPAVKGYRQVSATCNANPAERKKVLAKTNSGDLAGDWIKSSLSFSNGNCIEVCGLADGGVAVRNSRHPDGPQLRFTPGEWHAFLGGVRSGEFDSFGKH